MKNLKSKALFDKSPFDIICDDFKFKYGKITTIYSKGILNSKIIDIKNKIKNENTATILLDASINPVKTDHVYSVRNSYEVIEKLSIVADVMQNDSIKTLFVVNGINELFFDDYEGLNEFLMQIKKIIVDTNIAILLTSIVTIQKDDIAYPQGGNTLVKNSEFIYEI